MACDSGVDFVRILAWNKLYKMICLCIVVGFIFCTQPCFASASETQGGIEGIWVGILDGTDVTFRFGMTVAKDDGGRLTASLRLLDEGDTDTPFDSLRYEPNAVYLRMNKWDFEIEGTVNVDVGEMQTEFRQRGEVWPLNFTRIKEWPDTEVVVIGTNHDPTENYTVDDLKDILMRVKPQIVLLEFDTSFFNDSLTALKTKYEKITLETKVVTWLKKQDDFIFRPYDIEGRNEFYIKHKSFERAREMNVRLDSLYKAEALSTEAKGLYEARADFLFLRRMFQKDIPRVINTDAFDELIGRTHKYQDTSSLIALTPQLSEFRAFQTKEMDFWNERNDTMVENIMRYAKEFSGQRIAVLCGNEHRLYLREGLKRKGIGFVAVREYWEY